MDGPPEIAPSDQPCERPSTTAPESQLGAQVDSIDGQRAASEAPQVVSAEPDPNPRRRRKIRKTRQRKNEDDIDRMFMAWYENERSPYRAGKLLGISDNTVRKYVVARDFQGRAEKMEKERAAVRVTISIAERLTKSRLDTIATLEIWRRMVLNKALESAGIPPGTSLTQEEMQGQLRRAIAKIHDSAIGRELKLIAEIERIAAEPLEAGPQKIEGKITGEITVKGADEPTLASFMQAVNRMAALGN